MSQKPFVVTEERKTLAQIISAFSHLSTIQQYRVGNYKIDLYFPEYMIAVECDEYDHREYDRRREMVRQSYIEQTLNCIFVRYNPHSEGFNIGEVIYCIMMFVYATEPITKRNRLKEERGCI